MPGRAPARRPLTVTAATIDPGIHLDGFARGSEDTFSSQGTRKYYRIAVEDGQRVHAAATIDRKSTRLNSSHVAISYAVFCLKKKTDNEYNIDQVHNNDSRITELI